MKIPNIFYLLICAIFFAVSSCSQEKKAADQSLTSKGATPVTLADISFNGDTSSLGMVKIPAGTYMMGGDNQQSSEDEYPKHKVMIDAFLIDQHEVTNDQFAKFIASTGYLTTAERKPDWEEGLNKKYTFSFRSTNGYFTHLKPKLLIPESGELFMRLAAL